MIILFILLGLVFLGGGAAAIIDGLPYMVLERGFTQVIIGTVVAVAGVIMLALAQVLAKLRSLENKLSGTTMALSLAGAAGVAAREPGPSSSPSLSVPSSAEPVSGAAGPSAAAAVAGALAGAGLVGAAVAGTDKAEPEPATKADEPDLFGAHLASVLGTPALEPSDSEADATEAPSTGAKAQAEPAEMASDPIEAEDLPVFDPFRPVDPEPVLLPTSFEVDAPSLPLPDDDTLPPASESQEDSVDPWTDATAPEPDTAEPAAPLASDIDDPLTPAAPPAAAEDDEFGRLRESLAGLGLGPVGGRVEPRFDAPIRSTAEPEDLAAAASWMDSALSRRAPEPEGADAVEIVPPPRRMEPTLAPDLSWPVLDLDDRSVPAWPPQTQEVASAEPGTDAAPAWHETDRHETGRHEQDDEPAALPVETAPAASDEGIVGAYQVGEAHFTIYADGSIKARTPDGDYSFASMDELKVYLASEKSRLGS